MITRGLSIRSVAAFVICLGVMIALNGAGVRADEGASGAAAGGAVAARAEQDGAATAPGAGDTIAPGTSITMQNWQHYKQFMPDGMADFFAGKYSWKMPSDVQMEVGPTVIHPLPKSYLEATEKYSGQVKIIELADGALTLANYQGGMPFPEPAEPHRGWKILANVWYRYLPHLIVDTCGSGCTIDSGGNVNCSAAQIVSRQLSFNTDPGAPATIPGAEGEFSSEYFTVLEPEQDRYTTTLTISYADPQRPEDVYLFLPALRRYQPVSSAARCSQGQGTDTTQEDYRFGFNSNITEMKVDVVAEKKILSLVDFNLPAGKFPENFDMPLAWPKPSWGKWQLRNVYVISASKVPSKASGYCFGKRLMYVDKASFQPLWEDLYDAKMQPWKIFGLFLRTLDVPGIGPLTASGSMVWAFWNVQSDHASFFIDPASSHNLYVNDQAPAEYKDLTKYASPAGLNLIMR